jgi:hypothetical protein
LSCGGYSIEGIEELKREFGQPSHRGLKGTTRMQSGREKIKQSRIPRSGEGVGLKAIDAREAAGSCGFHFFPPFGSNLYLAFGRNMSLVATHKAIGV